MKSSGPGIMLTRKLSDSVQGALVVGIKDDNIGPVHRPGQRMEPAKSDQEEEGAVGHGEKEPSP